MPDGIDQQYPALFFDTKITTTLTPKLNPPSISQLMDKVLTANGIQNSGLAGTLGQAAEAYFAWKQAQAAKP